MSSHSVQHHLERRPFSILHLLSAEYIAKLLYQLAICILAALMFLTVADVFGRYFFNSPITGAQELSEISLMLITFLGISFTALSKEHVRVELLLMFLSPNVRLVLNILTDTISLIVSVAISYCGFVYTRTVYERGISTELLHLPTWPFLFCLSLSCAFLSLIFVKEIWRSSKEATTISWPASQIWFSFFTLLLVAAVLGAFQYIGMMDVEPVVIGCVGMLAMLCLLFIGVPIGFCMMLIGVVGMMYCAGFDAGFSLIEITPYTSTVNYSMTVVPLFILMGGIAFRTGLSKDLYMLVFRWVGHWPGGLAIAAVGGCACFAAISGSSLATAATMGMVSLPEMKRYNYDSALATGAIAAGGSIGILIPPSVVLILYGVLTNQPITELFVAGVIPGVMQALFYIITIMILCKIKPSLGLPGERSTSRQRWLSVKETWGVMVLFLIVMGGLYAGVFVPTEAGGIGAFGVLVFVLLRSKLTPKKFYQSLFDSVKTSSMCLTVFLGAMFLGYFLTVSEIPTSLSEYVAGLDVNRYTVLLMIIVAYLFLGCIMDSLSIVLLTVPVFFPVVQAVGFNPIWFGIIMVKVVEIGMITPPIGINVFVIKGVVKDDVPMHTIFKGIFPFLCADIVHLTLLILIPEICLFLPQLISGNP
ncbi:MAG: TRAP transporter large permease subunit [Desulfopila sp.]